MESIAVESAAGLISLPEKHKHFSHKTPNREYVLLTCIHQDLYPFFIRSSCERRADNRTTDIYSTSNLCACTENTGQPHG